MGADHPGLTAGPVIGFRYARGDAGFYVRIGNRRLSRVEIFTPNANVLHGRDADVVVVDEVWSFDADRAPRSTPAYARPAGRGPARRSGTCPPAGPKSPVGFTP